MEAYYRTGDREGLDDEVITGDLCTHGGRGRARRGDHGVSRVARARRPELRRRRSHLFERHGVLPGQQPGSGEHLRLGDRHHRGARCRDRAAHPAARVDLRSGARAVRRSDLPPFPILPAPLQLPVAGRSRARDRVRGWARRHRDDLRVRGVVQPAEPAQAQEAVGAAGTERAGEPCSGEDQVPASGRLRHRRLHGGAVLRSHPVRFPRHGRGSAADTGVGELRAKGGGLYIFRGGHRQASRDARSSGSGTWSRVFRPTSWG